MPHNDDTSAHDDWYSLGEDDRHCIDGIVQLIRSHTPHMSRSNFAGPPRCFLRLPGCRDQAQASMSSSLQDRAHAR